MQCTLDTVTQMLEEDPNRTYMQVETAFFSRWWEEQTTEKQDRVKKLVESGQLEFTNGGWCMHDEAAAHYVDMIDQTTRGHAYLKEKLGVTPKVGWQIDPFGHSAAQAYLLSKEASFEAHFFGRITYTENLARKANRSLEFIWDSSESLGPTSDIFSGAFASGNYGPPGGFCFDMEHCDDVIYDDPRLENYNVPQTMDLFYERCMELAGYQRGNDIILNMGSDFHYANANSWYKQLDKLIHYANKDKRLNVFYSTPERYVKAKLSSGIAFPTHTGDFFPYADGPNAYWTGFFTSRPTQKYLYRLGGSYLQAARQLEFLAGPALENGVSTDLLEDGVSIAQHHDGITGTAKQHVADDYALRVSAGLAEARDLVNQALASVREQIQSYLRSGRPLEGSKSVITPAHLKGLRVQEPRGPLLRGASAARASHAVKHGLELGTGNSGFEQCAFLNVSSCAATEAVSEAGGVLEIAVYNPVAWERTEVVRIPVATQDAAVVDGDGAAVVAQTLPVSAETQRLRGDSKEVFTLVFVAELPPAGYGTYFVSFGSSIPQEAQRAHPSEVVVVDPLVEASKVFNRRTEVSFDEETGHLASLKGVELEGPKETLKIGLGWYEGMRDHGQNDGAYIFRPDGDLHSMEYAGAAQYLTGPVVQEIRQAFRDNSTKTTDTWGHVEFRFYAHRGGLDYEWTVGPIPSGDSRTKNVVVRLAAQDLNSGKEFWTDSNGRDMLQRTRMTAAQVPGGQEGIAANYYPIVASIAIRDDERELSLLTDRAQSAASLSSGEMEVMVHRRTLVDDARGVGEALDETDCGCRVPDCPKCPPLTARGLHSLVLASSAQPRREAQQYHQDPIVLAFQEVQAPQKMKPFSMIAGAFPPNVQLLTLKQTSGGVLVRVAHIFQVGEDDELSAKASVDLQNLFPGTSITHVQEMNLSGNQLRTSEFDGERRGLPLGDSSLASETSVELGPMEVRTFLVRLKGTFATH